MTAAALPLDRLSRTELQSVAEEFRSERDAAKRDTVRAFDERNLALTELAHLRQAMKRLESAVARWWEGRRPVGWNVAQHAASAAVNAHYPADVALADIAAALATRPRAAAPGTKK